MEVPSAKWYQIDSNLSLQIYLPSTEDNIYFQGIAVIWNYYEILIIIINNEG